MGISHQQCRAARALLGWSQADLEKAAEVAKKTIADFEREARIPYVRTLSAIQGALEAAGVEFLPDNGVRMKRAQVAHPVSGKPIPQVAPSHTGGPDKVSHVGTPAPDQDAENGDLKGQPDQTAGTATRSTGSDSGVSGQLAPKPRRPRAKPLLMSKEAQIRALRERDR